MTKPSRWENIKGHALTKAGGMGMTGMTIYELIKHGMGLKAGGRVKPIGVGKATHGYGKAMKKK